MTNTITLTDEQLYWLQVALENAKLSGERTVESGVDDDDVQDGLFLVNKYTELQGIIGEPPPISL